MKGVVQNKEVQEWPNKTEETNPEVSVIVATYNHQKYVVDCLEGILSQKTTFKFEILIGEDNSSDRTRAICQKYAEINPDTIRLFLHQRDNNIKVDGKPTGRFNVLYSLSKVRGKYIAYCEGDDHWTDPYKLQKQFDVLEENPSASFCFSKVGLIFETERTTHSYLSMDHYPKTVTLVDYMENYYPIPHVTKMWRSDVNPNFESPEWIEMIHNVRFFDNALHFYHLTKGNAIFLDDPTANYRVQGGSVTHQAPKNPEWHIKEILFTHYHFFDCVSENHKQKIIAIRSFHYEKLLDLRLATKNITKLIKDIFAYLVDRRSGTLTMKLRSIGQTIRKHWSLRQR